MFRHFSLCSVKLNIVIISFFAFPHQSWSEMCHLWKIKNKSFESCYHFCSVCTKLTGLCMKKLQTSSDVSAIMYLNCLNSEIGVGSRKHVSVLTEELWKKSSIGAKSQISMIMHGKNFLVHFQGRVKKTNNP